jgi:hypothetical protein
VPENVVAKLQSIYFIERLRIMFVPFWLFIVLSGFGCYGALVFINAIRNRKSKVVSPSACEISEMRKK